ncbi:MAG TPA: hypothetical protein VMX36_06280, partial [Sedimentisphaerales bacterium]|nr:hypothetical protein [Sedimentisphaerales bacterium]
MEILKGNAIKTLSIILGAATVMLMPISAFGLELGFNEEITNNTGQDAYDFHLEGTLKSETLPVQVMDIFIDWPRGSIPGFDWTYDGGSITHAGGEYYNYSGKWSGKVPVPPRQQVHIGKAFEVTCENVFIRLRGWWTDRNGEKINPRAGTKEGETWISDVPLLGFDIQDNIPARLTDPNLPQTVTLQNATDMEIEIASPHLAVTDRHVPLEQLVPDSNLLSDLDWRDIPRLPPFSIILPGESWTFDLREMDVVIPPDWTTVIRTEVWDPVSGEYHFYAGKCQAHAASDPTVTVSTLDEWASLLNRPVGEYPRIDPVSAGVFADMVESSDEWPPEYRDAFFATPELDAREHEDGSGQIEPALYMRWGPEGAAVQPGQYYAAAWDYIYGKASDLSGVELEFSIHAPRESIRVSINLIDADGDWLEFIWHVGLPGEIPACQWTTVQLIPSTGQSNYRLQRPAFEGGRSDGRVDLTRITNIRFDENEVWTEELPFPLDDGWVWNAWNHIRVVPIRDVDIEENPVGVFDDAMDIGNPLGIGRTVYEGYVWKGDMLTQQYLIMGGGGDIWGDWDQFHYAYKKVSGEVRLSACFEWIVFSNDSAKAGVMLRNSLDGGSVHRFMTRRGLDDYAGLQGRVNAGGGSSEFGELWKDGVQALAIQRVTVEGLTFIEGLADFGSGWESRAIDLVLGGFDDEITAGVAITSHDDNQLVQARVWNVNYERNTALIGELDLPVIPEESDLGVCPSDVPGFSIRSLAPLVTDGWGYDAMNELLDTGTWMGLPAQPGTEGTRVDEFVNLRDVGNG